MRLLNFNYGVRICNMLYFLSRQLEDDKKILLTACYYNEINYNYADT